jgi:crotonobetainyl-CoA:carnitine CoA-transferase CaiB-like acyl-CoA transferase
MQTVLDNITVVDLTQALAGPYCTMMLGDLGADVIKIERPPKGDQSRGWGPPFLDGESAYFLSINRNKRGMTLNLKEPAAREVMHRLIERADVFVTNLPRTSSRQENGVDWETLRALNPRLVYCSITGYGMTGPYAERGGYDVIAQGESGLMSLTGEVDGDPIRYPIPIADVTTGIYSAFAIVAALLARERTGAGQFLDMALLDSQISWLTNVGGNYFATGERPPRLGNTHPTIVPYQPFRARDKHFIVGVGSERLWHKFCAALGMADTLANDPRFATNSDRLVHRQELISLLGEIFVQEDADVWVERFVEAGIPCGPINFVDEALAHSQAIHRGVVVELEHPLIGTVRSLGNPIHLSHTPITYRLPPPTLGQHTDEVLSELGYDEQGIEELRNAAAV